MPVIYLTIYTPWRNNQEGKPWLYIGSKQKDDPKYFGSVSSKHIPNWSNGLTLKDWWKKEIKENPQNFEKKILFSFSESLPKKILLDIESEILKVNDCMNSSVFFNRTNSAAGPGSPKGTNIGRVPWNKGLTKETDERVRKNSEATKIGRKSQNVGFWITNGNINKKCLDGNIPVGWRRGQTNCPLAKLKGEKHSQYGYFWITNGNVNKKVKPDSTIPENWRKGRVNVRKNKNGNI